MRSNTLYLLLLVSTVVMINAGKRPAVDGNQSHDQSRECTVQIALRFLLERVKGKGICTEPYKYPELKGKLFAMSDSDEGTRFTLGNPDTMILRRLGELCAAGKIIEVDKELFSNVAVSQSETTNWKAANKAFVLWPSLVDSKKIQTAVVDIHGFGQQRYEEGRAYERSRADKEAMYTMAWGTAIGIAVGSIATLSVCFRKPIFNP